jgi:hypothetical protein
VLKDTKVFTACLAALGVLAWQSAVMTPAAAAAEYLAGLDGTNPLEVSSLAVNTPYDCSTAAQFDKFMNLVPQGAATNRIVIRFKAGTFRTRGCNGTGRPRWPLVYGTAEGGFIMKNYWEVAGAGTNSTTILLTDSNVWNARGDAVGHNIVFQGPLGGGYAGLQIHDLTIDCNAAAVYAAGSKPRGVKLNLSAILIYGENCRVQNVVVKHGCGDVPPRWASEVFIIQAGGYRPAFVKGLLIDHCTIQDFFGSGNCSAITPVNCAGTISFNAVYLNAYGGQFAYNALALHGATFSHNYSANAARAFNNDSASNQCLTLKDNTFDVPGGKKGCFLMSSWNCSAHDNRINLLGPRATAFAIFGPINWLDSSRKFVGATLGAHDWQIASNIISATDAFRPAAYGFNLNTCCADSRVPPNVYCSPAHRISLEGNQVARSLSNIVDGTNIFLINNSGNFPPQPSGTYKWTNACGNYP